MRPRGGNTHSLPFSLHRIVPFAGAEPTLRRATPTSPFWGSTKIKEACASSQGNSKQLRGYFVTPRARSIRPSRRGNGRRPNARKALFHSVNVQDRIPWILRTSRRLRSGVCCLMTTRWILLSLCLRFVLRSCRDRHEKRRPRGAFFLVLCGWVRSVSIRRASRIRGFPSTDEAPGRA